MNEELVTCIRCEREIPLSNTRPDEHLKGPACKMCRLKLEMLGAGYACFGVDLATGESFTCKSIWEKSKSKVMAETDSGPIIWK